MDFDPSVRPPQLLPSLEPLSLRAFAGVGGAASRSLLERPHRIVWGAQYEDPEVEERLIYPGASADGLVVDAAYQPLLHMQTYGDGYREGPLVDDVLTDSRKVYTGPIYLQGREGTCGAWTTINGLLVIGVEPSVAVARDLLNRALPSRNGDPGGMHVFAAGGVVTEHSELGLAWHIPTLSGKDSPREVAGFLKEQLDSGSAVFAAIDAEYGTGRHAICIAGYDIREGRMLLQCLDSGRGEYAMSIDRLMTRVGKTDLAPFAAMGWPQAMPVRRSPLAGLFGV